MQRLGPRRGGFTLIELMLVVAIIGVLAAVAIPDFLRFQMRAKASECKTNLKAIAVGEESFRAEHGTYVAATTEPAAVPRGQKTSWPITDCSAPAWSGHGFCLIGWMPEGETYYQYEVVAAPSPAASAGVLDVFTADAASDIDGDGATSSFGYVKGTDATGANAVAGNLGCSGTGTFDHATMSAGVFATVGPCDATSGLSVF
jgi:type IV pilus assembly protein PilA